MQASVAAAAAAWSHPAQTDSSSALVTQLASQTSAAEHL